MEEFLFPRPREEKYRNWQKAKNENPSSFDDEKKEPTCSKSEKSVTFAQDIQTATSGTRNEAPPTRKLSFEKENMCNEVEKIRPAGGPAWELKSKSNKMCGISGCCMEDRNSAENLNCDLCKAAVHPRCCVVVLGLPPKMDPDDTVNTHSAVLGSEF